MRNLESGHDKIQKICDALRKETLDPAYQEAREIIENAQLQSAAMIQEAQEKTKEIAAQFDRELELKKEAFHASLRLACRQGIEQLKQKIEQQLLFRNLTETLAEATRKPEVIAELINRFMAYLESSGVEEELAVFIPKNISPREINVLLVKKYLEKLQDHSVSAGDFGGGVQIKLIDQHVSIDMTDRALSELLIPFIRADFRELLFQP